MLASGLLSGAAGYAVGAPLFLAKTRLQSEAGRVVGGVLTTGVRKGHTPSYRNGADVLRSCIRAEGLRGLWRGSGVLVARGAVLSSSQLAGYDGTKTLLRRWGVAEDGVAVHVLASTVAALALTTAVMPLDSTLSRYQAVHGVGQEGWSSPLRCAMDVTRREGPGALWRGWSVMFARMLPSSLVTFLLYESLRSVAGLGFLE